MRLSANLGSCSWQKGEAMATIIDCNTDDGRVVYVNRTT
jgi:hypothetical protein